VESLRAAGIDAVLLDLDDTLISTRSAMHAGGAAAVRRLWPAAGEEAAVEGAVRFRSDPGGHFAAYTRGELDFEAMRAARVRELGDWLGIASSAGEAAAFEEAYEPAFGAELRAFDDVLPLLVALGATGVPIGVLTNSSGVYTRRKLEATGLADRVGVVVTRDSLGFGKPDARVFAHACALLGATPARTVYVGDELAVDAVGALEAGLRAVWLRRSGYPVEVEERREAAARGIPLIDGLDGLLAVLAGETRPQADLGSPPAAG
jgi:putative hydrolase of the HAD superfamily